MFLNYAKCDLIKFTWGISSWGVCPGGFVPGGILSYITVLSLELLGGLWFQYESINLNVTRQEGLLVKWNLWNWVEL